MREGVLHVSWGSNIPYVLSLMGGIIIYATLTSFNTPWYVKVIAAGFWGLLIIRPMVSPRDVVVALELVDTGGKVVTQSILYSRSTPALPGQELTEDWGDHPYITTSYATGVRWHEGDGGVAWASVRTWPLTRRYRLAFWLSMAHLPLWVAAFLWPEPSVFVISVPALAIYILASSRENYLPEELNLDVSEVRS